MSRPAKKKQMNARLYLIEMLGDALAEDDDAMRCTVSALGGYAWYTDLDWTVSRSQIGS